MCPPIVKSALERWRRRCAVAPSQSTLALRALTVVPHGWWRRDDLLIHSNGILYAASGRPVPRAALAWYLGAVSQGRRALRYWRLRTEWIVF